MADPTIKNVLAALATLDKKITAVRDEMATKDALGALDAKVTKGFADLDAELTGHTKVHREIERKLGALVKKPARATVRTPRRR